MFYISLILSSIYFLIVVGCALGAKNPRSAYLKVWIGLPFCYLVMCIATGYLLHVVLTGAVGTLCWFTRAGRRSFLCGATAAFAVAYALIGVPRAIELWQLAKQYPFESVEQRLNYELGRPATSGPKPTPSELTDDDRYVMGLYFSARGARHREAALQDLHEGCVQMFVTAPGFGIVRFMGFGPDDIRRADPMISAPPIDLPESPKPNKMAGLSASDLVVLPPDPHNVATTVSAGNLRAIHMGTQSIFLDPTGFGYVRDRSHVAGFVSHRFTRQPPKPNETNDDGWRFESLDLVSLLKHTEPAAYVSKHLPRMDELRDAPTRPLDEFEADGLAKLRAGEELYYANGPRRVRMLGAIRARADCLKCHSVDQGELLGAFSYDLRRDLPAGP